MRGRQSSRRSAQALGPEQREERHRDGAALHGAEHGAVERQRRLQHDGHALAAADAQLLEQVGEARRPLGERAEVVLLAPAVGELDAQRRPLAHVPVDALVGEVQPLLSPSKSVPQRVPAERLARRPGSRRTSRIASAGVIARAARPRRCRRRSPRRAGWSPRGQLDHAAGRLADARGRGTTWCRRSGCGAAPGRCSRRRKPASPIQLVTRWPSQATRSGP